MRFRILFVISLLTIAHPNRLHGFQDLDKQDVKEFEADEWIHPIELSRDQKLLFAGGAEQGYIYVWNKATGKRVAKLSGHSLSDKEKKTEDDERKVIRLVCLNVSPNGKYLASYGADGYLRVWETSTWKEVFSRPTRLSRWQFSFSGDLLTGYSLPMLPQTATSEEKLIQATTTVSVLDWKKNKEVTFGLSKTMLSAVGFIGDDKTLLSANNQGLLFLGEKKDHQNTFAAVKLLDPLTGKTIRSIGDSALTSSFSVSSNHRNVYTAHYTREIHLWNLADGSKLNSTTHKSSPGNAFPFWHLQIRLSLNNQRLISYDGSNFNAWDTTKQRLRRIGQYLHSTEYHLGIASQFDISSDGHQLFYGDGNRIRVRRISDEFK